MAYKKKLKRTRQKVDAAVVHVKSTFNNTLVTITTPEGDVLLRSSAGKLGFKGSRKATPFAASQVAAVLAKDLMAQYGTRSVDVYLQGAGAGRDPVVRGVQASGLHVSTISDVTPIPHNGCRAPKKRRV